MKKISYLHYSDDETIDLLSSAFSNNNLVPVIGAGFTRGCQTGHSRTVPSGLDFKNEMINHLAECEEFDVDSIKKIQSKNFSAIAELYFNFVPKEKINYHLKSSFQNVKLDDIKKSFISDINWPYIYTLNADDAIERHSDYQVTHPYDSNLSERAKELPTLFKLHGDINYELRHDESRLVFQKKDYLKSLSSNKKMLDFLKLDLINKNVIYIGCSLSDELDISFLVAQENKSERKETRNIAFLSSKLDFVDEQEYLSVGIDTIITFEEGAYNQIYETLIKAYQDSGNNSKNLDIFKKPITVLDSDYGNNQDFLIKGLTELKNKDKLDKRVIPFYFGEREKGAQVLKSLKENEITILRGKRVSGKTLLAYHILNQIKDKNIFIINSNQRLDNGSIVQLLGQKNSIIFFDHGALNKNGFSLIKTYREKLSENKVSILICANDNDNDAEYVLNTTASRTGVIRLPTLITESELAIINKNAINSRLPTFTEGKHLLDKIYNVFNVIGEYNVMSKIDKSKELFILLYVIAIRHSFTGEEVFFSGFDEKTILELAEEHSPFLLIEQIDFHEQVDHTNFKITSYASSWVVSLLRGFFKEKGLTWCSDTLMELFKHSYKTSKQFVVELRKFDSLNFVFTASQHGAAALILDIYEKLNEIEGKEPEFYVQKSKAYFNMYESSDAKTKIDECIQELNIAYTWAKSSHSSKTQQNISHVKAQLCLKKVTLSKPAEINDIISTIDAIHQTINEEGNLSYNTALFKGKSQSGILYEKFMKTVQSNNSVELLLAKEKLDEIKLKMNVRS
ncbi:SIR2 family protein [Vibrio splendidus]